MKTFKNIFFAGMLLGILIFSMACRQNNPPEIIELSASPAEVRVNQQSFLWCRAVDEDDDQLTYFWSATGGSLATLGDERAVFQALDTGRFIVKCTVVDEHGAEDSASVVITVRR